MARLPCLVLGQPPRDVGRNAGINTLIFALQQIHEVHRATVSKIQTWTSGGDDTRNFEPKARLKFEDLDKSIQKLRAIYKVHPEWFEAPKPKSNKGKNEVNYSV